MEIKNKFIVNYPAIFTPDKPNKCYKVKYPDFLYGTTTIEDKGMEYIIKEASIVLARLVIETIENGYILNEPIPIDEIKPDPDKPNSFVLLLTTDAYPYRSRW